MITQISPAELSSWRADAARAAPHVVDVREPWEYAICRIEGSQHIPLGQLPARSRELPGEAPLVLVCHHGVRSLHAASWLLRAGFDHVFNLRGGLAAWAAEVEPTMNRY